MGQPLCAACYDYAGHVLWQAHTRELWDRFTRTLRRLLAGELGVPVRGLGAHVRVSFAKVAEFQARGVVHFHAVIRLDGPDGPGTSPPAWASDGMLNNWFLELTGDSGQIVLLLNPMWARRLGEVFPDPAGFQEYVHEHAGQAVDAFRPANAEILAAKGRVDDKGRVALAARPDQFVPVVCGGLGGLHGAALTTFVQSEMQSAAVVR